MLFSQEDRRRQVLLKRVTERDSVFLDQETGLVELGTVRRRYFAPESGVREVALAAGGVYYALFSGEIPFQFGLGRLGAYTVADYPGRRFPLGLYGRLRLRAAHAGGLAGLLKDADGQWVNELVFPTLFVRLELRLREALCRAVDQVNGEGTWRYELLFPAREQLSRQISRDWFPIFYENGLLLDGRSFEIEGLTAPSVEQ